MPTWLMVEVPKLIEPRNPQRRETLYERIDELRESIRVNGLQQPIGVQREGENYRIIYGHRRSVAVTQLGWSHVAAYVWGEDEQIDHDALMGAENYHRNAPSSYEEAIYYQRVVADDPKGTEGIATRFNVPLSRVENHLLCLTGLPEVVRAFQEGRVSVAQVVQINQFKSHGYQLQALQRALAGEASADTLRRWRKEIQRQGMDEAAVSSQEAWQLRKADPNITPQDICNIGNHMVALMDRKVYAICNEHYNVFLEGLEWLGKVRTIMDAAMGQELYALLAKAEGRINGSST